MTDTQASTSGPSGIADARGRIAVIGAGLAGLGCARVLGDAGFAVTLFDKGRGPGGRLATRRADTPLGEVRFDHGAQFLTARDPAFTAVADGWLSAGQAARFPGPVVHVGPDGRMGERAAADRLIGVPGMSALARALGEGLDIRFGCTLRRLLGSGRHWWIGGTADEPAGYGPYDALVLAIPAEQTATLLGSAPSDGDLAALASKVGDVVTEPTWAVMAVFDRRVEVPFNGASLEHAALGWIARETAKPGRSAVEAWTLHAGSAWSRAHLEDDAADVAAHLVAAFRALTGAPEPVWQAAHRWRYARVETPSGSPFIWNEARGIGLCGDWCVGARGEAAWLSGRALGRAMVQGRLAHLIGKP